MFRETRETTSDSGSSMVEVTLTLETKRTRDVAHRVGANLDFEPYFGVTRPSVTKNLKGGVMEQTSLNIDFPFFKGDRSLNRIFTSKPLRIIIIIKNQNDKFIPVTIFSYKHSQSLLVHLFISGCINNICLCGISKRSPSLSLSFQW